MLTAGDVQFEPPQTKIVSLTTSVVVMVAGDSAMQVEILYKVREVVQARVIAEPTNWWNVEDVAKLYSRFYGEARRARAERALLSPLGLNWESWIAHQQQLAPQLVTQLATELINFEAPKVSTIIAGVDVSGAHIFVVHGSDVTCQDSVGFAAIGIGNWHADSQLMFAGHTRTRPFPRTLLLAYSAKKRAEVAPGVGPETDMFLVGPQLGSYIQIGDHIKEALEEIDLENRKKLQRAAIKAEEKVQTYVEELNRATPTPPQQTAASVSEISGGDAPANQENPDTVAPEEAPPEG